MTTLELASLILAAEFALIAWITLFVLLRRLRRPTDAEPPTASKDGNSDGASADRLVLLEQQNGELTDELASARRMIARLLRDDDIPVPDVAPKVDLAPIDLSATVADAPAPPDEDMADLGLDIDAILEQGGAGQTPEIPDAYSDTVTEDQLDALFAQATANGEDTPAVVVEEEEKEKEEDDPLAAAFARAAAGLEEQTAPPAPADDLIGDAISEAELEELIDLFETPRPEDGESGKDAPDTRA